MSVYRKCAGAVVFNQEKKVLVCARSDKRSLQWQFPQGGIMKGETVAQAAVRELREETSVTSVKVVATLEKSVTYDFPGSVLRRFQARGIHSRGQEMFWSLLYFYGNESEIDLNTKQPEFKAWAWVDIDEAVRRIVYFKKDVYRYAVEQLKPLVESYKASYFSGFPQ